jgi:hypothetical protein
MANVGMLVATAAPVTRLTDLVRFDPMVSDNAQQREGLFISLRFVIPNRWTGAQFRIANIDVILFAVHSKSLGVGRSSMIIVDDWATTFILQFSLLSLLEYLRAFTSILLSLMLKTLPALCRAVPHPIHVPGPSLSHSAISRGLTSYGFSSCAKVVLKDASLL